MQIRFRTDGPFAADFAARHLRGEKVPSSFLNTDFDNTPPAVPGDCWRLRWWNDLPAGYALCCPGCKHVHFWTSARNCGSRRADGTCEHTAKTSCWVWTGSAEDGTLSASPSLHHDRSKGGCGWHGHLSNGQMRPDH